MVRELHYFGYGTKAGKRAEAEFGNQCWGQFDTWCS